MMKDSRIYGTGGKLAPHIFNVFRVMVFALSWRMRRPPANSFLLQGVVDVQLYIPYLQYRTDGRMRGIPSCSWQGIVPDKIIPARRFPFLTLKEGVIHSPHCVTRLIFRR